MNAGMLSSQFCHAPPSPWTNTSAGPSPPVSTTLTSRPCTVTRRVIDGQSTAIHVASSPSAYDVVGTRPQQRRSRSPPRAPDASSARRGLPYQRPCASPSTSTARCTTTGTSSRPPPSGASASSCPTRTSCGRSTACGPSRSRPASPRPTATSRSSPPSPTPARSRRSRAWHEAGHFIHITSHRHDGAHGATARWLERIGLPYDELYCSFDKVARCRRSASTC